MDKQFEKIMALADELSSMDSRDKTVEEYKRCNDIYSELFELLDGDSDAITYAYQAAIKMQYVRNRLQAARLRKKARAELDAQEAQW